MAIESDGRYLTYSQVEDRYGLSQIFLRTRVHRREIPHIRLSRRMVRFDKKELEAWLRDCSVKPEPKEARGAQNA